MSYRHDYAAFDDEVLCAGFMVDEMRARAEKIRARAIELAAPHYDPEDSDGDHYIDHFLPVEAGVQTRKTRRAYAAVINDHEAADHIEYGTVTTPKQRILGRALDAATD